MNEKSLYPEITDSFDKAGGFARKAHDAFYANDKGQLTTKENSTGVKRPSQKGIADHICLLPPLQGAAVEVKYAESNFNLSEISDDQRQWLNDHESYSFIWLGMGLRVGGKHLPRKTWLVPWAEWKRIEEVVKSHGLKGLSYAPHRTDLRGVTDAPVLLAPYELSYTNGVWQIKL